jgi:hypothetical protein
LRLGVRFCDDEGDLASALPPCVLSRLLMSIRGYLAGFGKNPGEQ